MPKLRKKIDQHCKSCVYDQNAAGTWKQQTTICSVIKCSLYPVRPKTKSPIPTKVLEYYRISDVDS
jgi:hypothetical protein